MLRINELCKKHSLSRSTLLYYDSIGLFKPSSRSEGNYRLYSEDDSLILEKICSFRKAGVSLEEIKQLLDFEELIYNKILIERFKQINQEIQDLRNQQACIASMLKNKELLKTSELISKETWKELMHSSGFDEKSSRKWHMMFEQISPPEHSVFLETLGFSKEEIVEIKQWSKSMVPDTDT